MFAGWGRVVVRARWLVLALSLGLVVLGATWGTGVFDRLTDGGFYNEHSPSAEAADRIESEFGRTEADIIALYTSPDLTVADRRFADAVTGKATETAELPEVDVVASYWSTGAENFRSVDGHATYLAITLSGIDDVTRAEQYESVADRLAIAGFTTQLGGRAAVFDDVNSQTQDDLITAETYSLPILLILLVVIFGSLVAAVTPLVIGILAIMGGFVITRLLTTVTDVSVFAVNVITIIGLGLAIDYALFVVSRFREESAAGRDRTAAVARTMSTAGRTVVVSGLTIMLSLAGLLIFPLPFLHGIAYGGMSAVAMAMLGSLTALPALLAVLGPRVDALAMPWRRGRTTGPGQAHGAWAAIGRSVMRRPVWYIAGVLVVLAVAAGPLSRVTFGAVDERVLPVDTASRVVTETVRDDFPGGNLETVTVLVEATPAEAVEVVAKIENLDPVDHAQAVDSTDDAVLLRVHYDADRQSPAARELVDRIDALDVPGGGDIVVAGTPAQLADLFDDLGDRLPWLAGYVALVTLVLLFLAFGSVLLPVKAILMNVVSIGASFGVVVWIFGDGHLSGLLGFTPSGYLEPTNLLLMVVLLFGLSTDYEVFLLSRVREEWDHGSDNTDAVLTGLQRTGGIITSAALLLIVVVSSFAAGGIVYMKMLGLGMAVAIFVDATLVRMLLVPATMRILGSANWWAPRFLRRLHSRYGVKEG